MAERLTLRDGRAGSRGKSALYVLVASIGLMLAAMVGLLIWNGAEAPASHADARQAASRQEITGSPSGTGGATFSANSSAVHAGHPAYPQPTKHDAN